MEWLSDFLNWAWARHHNPLSWYIRPLFVLPFVYFAYRRSTVGIVVTVIAVLTSMFWFPAPAEPDARAAAFLAAEREYITGEWGWLKTLFTLALPVWFALLAWAFWKRSWLTGFLVINLGVFLKVIWSFAEAGNSAWSIVPPVLIGAVVVNGVLYAVYRRGASGDLG